MANGLRGWGIDAVLTGRMATKKGRNPTDFGCIRQTLVLI